MAKIHDLFIVELAEVIKGYGNNPDVEDPFSLSEFYRFYELPNIAVSRENFEKMRPIEPQRMRGKGRWNAYYHGEENGKSIFSYSCNQCGYGAPYNFIGGVCEQKKWNFCPNCGADMRGTE